MCVCIHTYTYRYDFFQQGGTVTLSIYAKKVDPEQCKVELSATRLSLSVRCSLALLALLYLLYLLYWHKSTSTDARGAVCQILFDFVNSFNLDVDLTGRVDPEACKVEIPCCWHALLAANMLTYIFACCWHALLIYPSRARLRFWRQKLRLRSKRPMGQTGQTWAPSFALPSRMREMMCMRP